MRIGTFVEKSVDSELSGNVIDMCPVGALTSKPFRFRARAWEMQQREAVSPHDAVGANLSLHVSRNRVMRAVPRVVVSNWNVQDQGTKDLMIAFHRKLRAGAGAARALRDAKLEMRKSKAYAHPYHWAPFVVWGLPD